MPVTVEIVLLRYSKAYSYVKSQRALLNPATSKIRDQLGTHTQKKSEQFSLKVI